MKHKKYSAPWPIYKRLLGYVRPYWIIFIIGTICSMLYAAIDAGLVRLVQPIIDEGFVAKNTVAIRQLIVLLPLAFIARGLMNFGSEYSMAWISRRVVSNMRVTLFDHLLKMPATFYDYHPTGELLSKLTFNVEQIAKASTDVIMDSVRNIFLIIFLCGVMISVNWLLTCLFFVAVPLAYLMFTIASRLYRKFSHKIQNSMALVTHLAEENIKGYKVVRVFGGETYESEQFHALVEKNRKQEMKHELTKAVSTPLIQVIMGMSVSLTLYIATTLPPETTLTAGGFAVLVSAMIGLLKPVKDLTKMNSKIQRGLAGAESIFQVIDEVPEDQSGIALLKRAQGHIRFENVSFTYPSGHHVALEDIHFSIDAHQTVALVGRSGSGKSTLMNLLPRLYDNYAGKILLDGVDTRTLSLKSLREQMALVTQNVLLFDDTIANNIAYGDKNIDHDRVVAAAEAAHVMSFIENFPDKLNAKIGQDGVLLSGGQRQRIAIARALYKNAPILILDEATSALDSLSEKYIQDALAVLMKNRTTLVIAHRLSTIEHADKIIVMDEGRIIEMGTHHSLMAKQGHYAQLYHTQFKQTEEA